MRSNIPEVQRTMHRFLTVQAAVTPTSVFPAPKLLKRSLFTHLMFSPMFYNTQILNRWQPLPPSPGQKIVTTPRDHKYRREMFANIYSNHKCDANRTNHMAIQWRLIGLFRFQTFFSDFFPKIEFTTTFWAIHPFSINLAARSLYNSFRSIAIFFSAIPFIKIFMKIFMQYCRAAILQCCRKTSYGNCASDLPLTNQR